MSAGGAGTAAVPATPKIIVIVGPVSLFFDPRYDFVRRLYWVKQPKPRF